MTITQPPLPNTQKYVKENGREDLKEKNKTTAQIKSPKATHWKRNR